MFTFAIKPPNSIRGESNSIQSIYASLTASFRHCGYFYEEIRKISPVWIRKRGNGQNRK